MTETNETIEVFFNLGQENIDWIKRAPRKIIDTTPLLRVASKENTNKNTTGKSIKTNNLKSISKKPDESIFRNINNIKKYLTNREKEAFGCFNTKTEYEFIGRLDALLDIMEENKSFYTKIELQECINRITKIKQKVWGFPISNTKNKTVLSTTKTNTIKVQTNSKRGIELQNRLHELKSSIKRNDLSSDEIQKLLAELTNIKTELETKQTSFTKLDNVPIKLSQVCNYIEKLNNKTCQKIENDNSNPLIEIELDANKINEKTQRGEEIQILLSELREETKRKDLNPIEKENIRNTLLKLQKEMTDEIDKFSKFDSIPVRLNQVENYLKKLEEKEPSVKNTEKTSIVVVASKENISQSTEQGKNKKERMKTIWRFGL